MTGTLSLLLHIEKLKYTWNFDAQPYLSASLRLGQNFIIFTEPESMFRALHSQAKESRTRCFGIKLEHRRKRDLQTLQSCDVVNVV